MKHRHSRFVAIVILLFWAFVAYMAAHTSKHLTEKYAQTADDIRYTANAPRT